MFRIFDLDLGANLKIAEVEQARRKASIYFNLDWQEELQGIEWRSRIYFQFGPTTLEMMFSLDISLTIFLKFLSRKISVRYPTFTYSSSTLAQENNALNPSAHSEDRTPIPYSKTIKAPQAIIDLQATLNFMCSSAAS